MASIGRGNLKCKVKGCSRIRPYWADECKQHRETRQGGPDKNRDNQPEREHDAENEKLTT
jgi:hypothetical protein